jgi:hypothetical protein
MQIYLNPRDYTQDFVKQLQCKVQSDMLAGVQVTQFISEGTQLQGTVAVPTAELIRAIDIYWDEVNGEYITETQPNFNSYPVIIQGQQY